MRAKLVGSESCPNPRFDFQEYSKALKAGAKYPEPTTLTMRAGTVLDEPDCWKLVRLGVATPEDEECRIAAGVTEEEFMRRREIYLKTKRGMLSNKPEQNAREPRTLDDDVSPEAANA